MYRKLQAFLRQEREEIAAVLPALFGAAKWPREAWWIALVSPLLLLTSPKAAIVTILVTFCVQILLLRAKASLLARACGFLFFFALPVLLAPEPRMGPVPVRAESKAREVREACLERGRSPDCRGLVYAFPEAISDLSAEEELKAWRVFTRPLGFDHYSGPKRLELESSYRLALASFQRRRYDEAASTLGLLGRSVDTDPELEFYRSAAMLGAQLQREASARRPAASTVAILESDGEALRWSAANDKRARTKLLLLAVRLRSLDPSNQKALEWMRALGVRK